MQEETTFGTGMLKTSEAALSACTEAGQEQIEFILLHASGDYGEVPDKVAEQNENNIGAKGFIMSVYPLGADQKLCVLTPKGHKETMLLLADELKHDVEMIPVPIPAAYLTSPAQEYSK